jgi:glycosyltransferase involved in cell wall biosynthesis
MPLVISLHGSDVYVAEKLAPARVAARAAFARAGAITACSDDLARRAVAIGADASRVDVVPYGVDAARFCPDERLRAETRASLGVGDDSALVFTAGRLVRKKGFEYLVDALASQRGARPVVAAIAGEGDLGPELHERARRAGVAGRIRFLGRLTQDEVARHLSAADVVVVPSVRDDAGNVDGLPNVVLEALASGTPLVTTTAGGIGSVVSHDQTGLIVPERDARAIADSIAALADDPARARRLGTAARALVQARFGWEETARRLEAAYDRALAFKSIGR